MILRKRFVIEEAFLDTGFFFPFFFFFCFFFNFFEEKIKLHVWNRRPKNISNINILKIADISNTKVSPKSLVDLDDGNHKNTRSIEMRISYTIS